MSRYDPSWRKFPVHDGADELLAAPVANVFYARTGPPAPGNSKPTLAISADYASLPEGSIAGSFTPYTFTVTRTGDISGTSTVSWALSANGTGLNAADFGGILPSGGVFFAANDAVETITVLVAADSLVELNEGFTVTLSRASKGTTIGTSSANGLIINDDSATLPLPSLAIAANTPSIPEGNSSTTAYNFTVTRSGDISVASSASWSVVHNGTSAADFSGPLSGTVSFTANQATSQTITINVVGDTVVEADEGFTVALTSPSGATLGTASANGTITNDDTALPNSYLSSAPGSSYNIQIMFAGTGWTPALTALVQDTADILSGIVTGDVSNIPYYPLAPYVGYAIDDILITVTLGTIDGAGDPFPPYANIVAQTEINAYRDSTDVGGATNELSLPVTATITLDLYDVNAAGTALTGWDGLLLHEMIHALGFAAPIFDLKNLSGGSVFAPKFLGGHAGNAYEGGEPLATASGSFEQAQLQLLDGSHWDESNFNPALTASDLLAIGGLAPAQELMTAIFTSFGEPAWLSDVTIGALADLGYSIADPSPTPGVSGVTVASLFA